MVAEIEEVEGYRTQRDVQRVGLAKVSFVNAPHFYRDRSVKQLSIDHADSYLYDIYYAELVGRLSSN